MFSQRNATSANLFLVLAFTAGCSSYSATINKIVVDAGAETGGTASTGGAPATGGSGSSTPATTEGGHSALLASTAGTQTVGGSSPSSSVVTAGGTINAAGGATDSVAGGSTVIASSGGTSTTATQSTGGVSTIGGSSAVLGSAGTGIQVAAGGTENPNTSLAVGGISPTGGIAGLGGVSSTSSTAPAGGSVSTGGSNGIGGLFTIGGATSAGGSAVATSTLKAIAVAVGSTHSCAVMSDRSIKCWGLNAYGQLGTGSSVASYTPSTVVYSAADKTLESAQVALGSEHTCSLLSDGTVRCWGVNSLGQLGNSSSENSSVPVVVSSLSNVNRVSASASSTCALIKSGEVKCWGANWWGQLGDGTTNDSGSPVSVVGVSNAIDIEAGGGHVCALISNGEIECWGLNGEGQLGNGSNASSPIPVKVSAVGSNSGNAATIVTAGSLNSCALVVDKSVQCWGASSGLGNGSQVGSKIPTAVSGLTSVKSVTVGAQYACVVQEDETAQCWGLNTRGQLGNDSLVLRALPSAVVSDASSAKFSGVASVAAGDHHTCATMSNGQMYCWGGNEEGQLGNGTKTDSLVPSLVSGF